jgi:hypothetical protein
MLTFKTLVRTTQRTPLPVVPVLLHVDFLLVYCAVALQWLHIQRCILNCCVSI